VKSKITYFSIPNVATESGTGSISNDGRLFSLEDLQATAAEVAALSSATDLFAIGGSWGLVALSF